MKIHFPSHFFLKKRLKKNQCFFYFFILFIFYFLMPSYSFSKNQETDLSQSHSPLVKNLILFIGDGMGSSVINATRLQFYGKNGSLTIDQFPHVAKIKTSSLDSWVTDSAAAASAMATGKKALNGSLSLSKNLSLEKESNWKKEETLLEMAAKRGKQVGLLTTTSVTDATPAAFYAHVESRKNTQQIVKDLIASPVHLIMGGGWKDLNLYEQDLKKEFSIERKIFSKDKCPSSSSPKKLMAIFSEEDLPAAIQSEPKEPLSLPRLTELALECLSTKKNGFFLMAESEDIDESLHSRNIPQALYATRDLDIAIKNTLLWLDKKQIANETLVLVVADHDTGGLAVNDPVPEKGLWIKEVKKGVSEYIIPSVKTGKYLGPAYPVVRLSTEIDKGADIKNAKAPHTSADVDLFACGPGSDRFHGTMENTKIFTLAKELFIDDFPKEKEGDRVSSQK